MKRRTKIMMALVAATLAFGTLGIVGCNDNADYADYINPTHVEETAEKYNVKVQSEGGLPLTGVKVYAYRGETLVKTSFSSEGLIELAVTLGEYSLRVDESSLPSGYYLPDGWVAPKTNPNEREEVLIKIPSKLVTTAATSYKLGQVMSNFNFTDCSGTSRTLSSILDADNKKAIVLNFFYTGCNPCRSEFPAVQTAYSQFSDSVEILAICSTHNGDNDATVRQFKSDYSLSFPMGIDNLGLCKAFGVSAFPTTVVIDRYGLIAYKTTGGEPNASFWINIFNSFTSDNYTQKLSSEGTGEGNTGDERPVPTVDMPASSVLEAAANGSGIKATYSAEPDDIYSWPFLSSGEYIYSSNSGVGDSYSIVHVAIEMKAGDVISFEYCVPSEKDCDILYVFVDGQVINAAGWSDVNDWRTANVYVSDRDYTADLSFAYIKDAEDLSQPEQGKDMAKIRNIHLLKSSDITIPMDVMRPAVIGDNSIQVELSGDGYYHKKDGSRSLLYMSLVQPTLWTDRHMDESYTTLPDGTYYYNNIYYMTYYLYREGDGASVKFLFDNPDATDTANPKIDLTEEIIEAQRIQMFMEEPYYLIPVTEKLQLWMKAFTMQYAKDCGRTAGDEEWLEMCYYFDHYGETDAKSYVSFDHTRGLRKGNAYTAYEMSDGSLSTSETKGVTEGSNRALVEFPLQIDRGTYYKFTAAADKAGVYRIRSYTHSYGENEEEDASKVSSKDVNPSMFIVGENNRFIAIDSILDFEQFTTDKYSLSDFCTYLVLEANQTIYLKMCCDVGATGFYDFSIEYLGAQKTVTEVCVTAVGLWESQDRVYTIETTYVKEQDAYFALENGEPASEIYVDFTHPNFMIYGKYNSLPLETYIDEGVFADYNCDPSSPIDSAQTLMENYLAEAKQNGGKVKADYHLVYILQQLINDVCDGGGEGNGWLMFAIYDHTYGN